MFLTESKTFFSLFFSSETFLSDRLRKVFSSSEHESLGDADVRLPRERRDAHRDSERSTRTDDPKIARTLSRESEARPSNHRQRTPF